MNSVEIQWISDLTFSFLLYGKHQKMLFVDAILGWAKNQCLACRVSMFGNYYPKSFPGHSHFRILVFPH